MTTTMTEMDLESLRGLVCGIEPVASVYLGGAARPPVDMKQERLLRLRSIATPLARSPPRSRRVCRRHSELVIMAGMCEPGEPRPLDAICGAPDVAVQAALLSCHIWVLADPKRGLRRWHRRAICPFSTT